jgi:hypothetical protein
LQATELAADGSVEAECWAIDTALVEKMRGRSEVLLYCTLPVTSHPASDWGNLVVLAPVHNSTAE